MILEFSNILTFISLILIIFTLIYLIYQIFSRSKYTSRYISKYTKDMEGNGKKTYFKPPSNDPPTFLNSLFDESLTKSSGKIDINCFYCALLDLINRKYISVKIVNKKNQSPNKVNLIKKLFNNKHDSKNSKFVDKVILKVNNTSLKSDLRPFEKNILKCVSTLEYNGNIDILNINKVIKKRLKVNIFQKNYDAWMKNFYLDFFLK